LLPTPLASDATKQCSCYGRGNPTLRGVLLPTPTSSDSKASGAAGYEARTATRQRHSGTTLTDAVVRGLPTPRARDWKAGGKDGLEERVSTQGARLNPSFVEWMMGWPSRWTETVSSSSATASSRKPPLELGPPCGSV
jgi:hypothetical protein